MDRLLIVDDDRELTELVAEYLESEDFAVEVANNGADGLRRALTGEHALVILDVMMPGMNGIEVLRSLRAVSKMPVLMLTAKGDPVDRIIGLEIGADDYMPKPFDSRELVARIRAILRRTRANEEATTATGIASKPDRITVGDVTIDKGVRVVRRVGEPVELTNVEYEILLMLLESPGRIVTREDLVREVLGRKLSPFDRSLDMHISHLRKKLGHTIGEAERIKTVRGVGYIYAKADKEALA
jgi:DNA-binding response OmpR family regulator